MRPLLLSILLPVCMLGLQGCQKSALEIGNDTTGLSWRKSDAGWKIQQVSINAAGKRIEAGDGSGEHTFLYSEAKPDSTLTTFETSTGVVFPEPVYRYQKNVWEDATHPVTLNKAGTAIHFFPAEAFETGGTMTLSHESELASTTSRWTMDREFSTDIVVTQTLIAKKDGYYSLASPTLTTIDEDEMKWATVPGYFQSSEPQDNFVSAYAYGHGVPAPPVIYRERASGTLAPTVDMKNGVSIAITPEPGLARDPWMKDQNTHQLWSVALSHRNRRGKLAPTLYHPVLGEPASKLKAGDSIQYEFRYSIRNGDWYENLSHIINDVYQFKKGLALRRNKQSLSDRIRKIRAYLTDTKTSMWNIENFEGVRIGAQSYLGGVVGSDRDAMKNADYGAMWMLAHATADPFLKNHVLPYALNFKMKQQQTQPGFFKGAAIGQYYLSKRKIFVEEWGEFIEPISLTYYTMLDIGNMMLFEPGNDLLKERLELGAELLLKWQKDDGSWEVAYDRETQQPLFTDLKDLRPTFYGLVVAYRMLKDDRYLKGAIKGADWLIVNAVDKGHFIGVCGDARYAPDFATGQTAQALLDLYDLTKEEKHKDAAIRAARLYTTSIYTHPVPSKTPKIVKGVEREDWEIAQAGLSFEHAGLMGSAQRHGPIQLASHAGMFVRIFDITRDSLFLDMARAAAIGRDAFVDQATSVASYYWDAMNRGAGPYPHHAWWQIGWITDYLMAEAEHRSDGKVTFPRGFVTPKVGPHQTYGFENGNIYDQPAELIIRDGMVSIPEPNIEFITARSPSDKRVYVVLMNAINEPLESSMKLDVTKLERGAKIKSISPIHNHRASSKDAERNISLPPYGLQVYTVEYE